MLLACVAKRLKYKKKVKATNKDLKPPVTILKRGENQGAKGQRILREVGLLSDNFENKERKKTLTPEHDHQNKKKSNGNTVVDQIKLGETSEIAKVPLNEPDSDKLGNKEPITAQASLVEHHVDKLSSTGGDTSQNHIGRVTK